MVFPDGRRITTFDYAKLAPSDDEGIWLNVAEILTTRFVLFNQTVAIRRKVLEKIGGFNESFRILEDYELALRLSLEGPWAYIGEPLVRWLQESPNSMTQMARSEELFFRERIVAVRQVIWERMQKDGARPELRRRFIKELQWAKRWLLAEQLRQRREWTSLIIGRMLNRYERYRRALYRRSPWYPRMAVAPVGTSTGMNNHLDGA
jgi:GT2 family glycosyltransferase